MYDLRESNVQNNQHFKPEAALKCLEMWIIFWPWPLPQKSALSEYYWVRLFTPVRFQTLTSWLLNTRDISKTAVRDIFTQTSQADDVKRSWHLACFVTRQVSREFLVSSVNNFTCHAENGTNKLKLMVFVLSINLCNCPLQSWNLNNNNNHNHNNHYYHHHHHYHFIQNIYQLICLTDVR